MFFYRYAEFILIGLMSIAILFALTLEHLAGLDPCPLCLLQRLVCLAIILIAVITLLAYRRACVRKIGQYLNLGLLLTGSGIGARHVWIQHLPPGSAPPECGASLDYLMQVLPIQEVLAMVLTGSGECQKVTARFLSFSLAEWTFALFVLTTLLYGYSLFRKNK